MRQLPLLLAVVVICGCAERQPHPPVAPAAVPVVPAQAIPIQLPADHRLFTVVIDDASGVRVRNLISMGAVTNPVMTVAWDGKDDDGKAVPPGSYTVRGLSLPGLDALYEYSFYNPGTPPWHGYPNSHWGSNHGDPITIACVPAGVDSPWRAVIGCSGSEGTDYLFAVGKNDRKVWGRYQGWGSSYGVVIDKDTLFAATGNTLARFSVKDAAPIGWQRPAGTIPSITFDSTITALAIGPTVGAVMLDVGERVKQPTLVVFDKATGRATGTFALASDLKLAFDPHGTLYAVPAVNKGGNWGQTNDLVTINTTSGALAPVKLPGVVAPGPFTFDAAGQLYLMDYGPDHQVKVFSPDHRLVRTIGVKGGAQQGNRYEANGLLKVLALAVDDRGYLWTSEGAHPRRQAVWDANGKLVRDWVGSAYYGAWNSFLHDQDPTIGAVWNVLFKIDPAQTQSYRPVGFITTGSKPESQIQFNAGPPWAYFQRNTLFRSKISGRMREYFIQVNCGYPVLYVKKGDDYRPVAALWTKDVNHAIVTPWSRPQDPQGTLYVWSDLNEDEVIQPNEVVVPGTTAQSLGGCVNAPPDLEWFVGECRITPTRFSAVGAPIYESTGVEHLTFTGVDKVIDRVVNDPNNRQRPNGLLRDVGDHLYGGFGSWPTFFAGIHTWYDRQGKVVATRRLVGAGVHGSMAYGKMVPAGETLGELFVSGAAKVNDAVGSVMAIQGDCGQAYFFTEDGMFVSSLFRDYRDHPEGWGAAVVRGKSWKNITMNQESFSAWFGRQDDGKCRYMFGHTSANVVEVTGLEQVRPFVAGRVQIAGP